MYDITVGAIHELSLRNGFNMNIQTKEGRINAIKSEILNFKSSPLYAFRVKNKYQPVIGAGSLEAKIMLIGEAPGQKEAETGKPFVGAAGKVLDELLSSVGLSRAEVYITNLVNDRPPGNRDPVPKEIELYASFLFRQIKIIKPKALATLGRFSMSYLMNKCGLSKHLQPISKIHGREFSFTSSYGKVILVPLYHPAVALYRAPMKQILMEDFRKLKQMII